MNQSVVGAACGVLVGCAIGWYTHPTEATGGLREASLTAPGGANAGGEQRFRNTRATLTQILVDEAKRVSPFDSVERTPVLLQMVQTSAWEAPIETARSVIRAGLEPSYEDEVLRAIARTWVRRDGVSVLQTLVNEDAYAELKRFYYPVFAIVTNEWPFEALPTIMALEDHGLRNSLFANLAIGVKSDEVPRLAQVLMGMPVNDRQWIVRNHGGELAQKNPEFALAWAAELTSPEAAELKNWALRSMAESDPLRAIALAESGGVRDRESVELNALGALSRTDPQSAVAIYEKTDDVYMKSRMVSFIAQEWGDTDPAGTAQWLLSIGTPNAELRDALRTLAEKWAGQDVDAAAAFADKVDEAHRGAWMIAVAQTFMYVEPERYSQWVEQFRAEPYYPLLLNQTVWPLERTNPEGAINTVLALDSSVRSEPLQKLIEQFAEHDPKRAAGWLSQIPDEAIRLDCMDRLMQTWSYQSPDDALQWVDTLAAGPFKDAALAAVVAHTSTNELGTMSQKIANRDTRIEALLRRGVRPQTASEIVAVLHEVVLDERQWKALEVALARP